VVSRPSGELWLFWQSSRRGRTEIWARVLDSAVWSDPERLSEAAFLDEMPAAAVDASGNVWLFWSADLGDRSNLMLRVRRAGAWDPVQPVTEGQHRDLSPAAVWRDGAMWLFWHSNRGGPWRLWFSVHDGLAWSEPLALTAGLAPDKEPAAVLDGAGALRLFWRSQRGGDRYKSRTVDAEDAEMTGRLQTYDDRAHYSFDTGLDNEDRYAPDTVGMYLTPDVGDADEIARRTARVERFMEPFRPAPVRFVWVLETAP